MLPQKVQETITVSFPYTTEVFRKSLKKKKIIEIEINREKSEDTFGVDTRAANES